VTATHYEGLIAPLYELMYELASAPAGRRVQQRVDRWIGGAAAIAHAPQHVSRRLAGTTTAAAPGLDVCAVHVRAAMQTVCRQLDIPPGIVVFGHTHVPLDGVTTPDGRHRLFNSGAWVVDRRPRRPQHGRCRRPGTVLRATGGVVELRELLADCDERGLERMAGAGSP
jgi:hypothetical protein